MDAIGNKYFMEQHVKGYKKHILIKAYKAEEQKFNKLIRTVSRHSLPNNGNVMSSHVIYKRKINGVTHSR